MLILKSTICTPRSRNRNMTLEYTYFYLYQNTICTPQNPNLYSFQQMFVLCVGSVKSHRHHKHHRHSKAHNGQNKSYMYMDSTQWDKHSFKGSLSTFECHSVILKIITNYEKGTVCTARKDWLRQGSTQF